MKPIVINIKSLIGTIVIIGNKETATAQIQEAVNDALLKVVTTARNLENQESCPDKTSLQSED